MQTNSDILSGTVSILMMILYIGLGVYSHRLAFRLFVHPKFLELMRLHSKTIIKLNAAVVVQLILVAFVLVQVGSGSECPQEVLPCATRNLAVQREKISQSFFVSEAVQHSVYYT